MSEMQVAITGVERLAWAKDKLTVYISREQAQTMADALAKQGIVAEPETEPTACGRCRYGEIWEGSTDGVCHVQPKPIPIRSTWWCSSSKPRRDR